MITSTYCQSLQFLWFCVVVCNPMLNCCSGMGVSTSEGDGKCSEDNVVIREGIYYFKLFIKVLEADMDANVLFLVREIVMYLSKYFQS